MKRIVMMGTDFGQRGGASAVLTAWRDGGLMDEWGIRFIPTHRSTGRVQKIGIALGACVRLATLLASRQVEAVHVHVSSGGSFLRKLPLFAMALAARRPLIVHVHGGNFIGFHRNASPLMRAAINLCLRRAQAVVALSPSWARRLADLSGRRVDCIVNPAPTAPPSACDRPAPPGLRVLFLGHLLREKGVFDLLEAFARITHAHPDATLEIAGEGLSKEVRHAADALGLGDRVRLHGWVDGARKERLLAQGTLLVLPSYMEGMPVCVLEAMTHGLPVVATKVGGIPDLVQDGVTGYLVEPGKPALLAEAIDKLLAAAGTRHRMGVAAQRIATQGFGIAAVRGQLRQVYASLGIEAPSRPISRVKTLER